MLDFIISEYYVLLARYGIPVLCDLSLSKNVENLSLSRSGISPFNRLRTGEIPGMFSVLIL